VQEIEAICLELPQGLRMSLELLYIHRSLKNPCHILHWRDIPPCYIQRIGKSSAVIGSEKINQHCGTPDLTDGRVQTTRKKGAT